MPRVEPEETEVGEVVEEADAVSAVVVVDCCVSSSWSDKAPRRDEIADEVAFDGGDDVDVDTDAPLFKRDSTPSDVAMPEDVPLVSGPTDRGWKGGKVVVALGCVGMLVRSASRACARVSSATSKEVDGDRDSMANKPRSPSPVVV